MADKKIQKVLISSKIRPSHYKKLIEIAEKKEMNISELIRAIVENYIEMV